jgi:7,8-dihydropterin-6-yl-methyl-4-(beta-D-ribofuranosyl)aminobenzene 5'-phosphate synthase
MNKQVRITVLVDNTVRSPGLLAEHGLSYWIDTGTHHVLFDTGQGMALVPNMNRMGIDPANADALVLSHGHYDHTGALGIIFNVAVRAKLFLHPHALVERYSCREDLAHPIGMPAATAQQLTASEQRLAYTIDPNEVVPGMFVTGEVPRKTQYEDTGGLFFLDAACRKVDDIHDDQALFMDTNPGLIVILGCAHAGMINTLNYVADITHRPIHAVIGGTHLVNASADRIAQTIQSLRTINPKLLVPAHCTGPRGMAALWEAFPDQIADGCVGTQWNFP